MNSTHTLPDYGSTFRLPSFCILTLALLSTVLPLRAQEAITVTVAPGERQTFRGIGFGLNGPTTLTHPASAAVNKLIFDDLGTRFLRLWYRPSNNGLISAEQRFMDDYVTSGVIADARTRGIEKILLIPTQMVSAPVNSSFSDYAAFIADLRDNHDTVVDVTSLQNEPSPSGWTGATIIDAINSYRAALDGHGLTNVEIIGADSSNADNTWSSRMQAVRDDPAAWSKIIGVSTHSYTMAANSTWAALSEGKDYWQTEAGWMDPSYSSLVSRFLNDVNQRVSHWFSYIGALAPNTSGDGSGHRLVLLNSDGTYTINPNYYFLKQLSQTFPVGSVFRYASSNKSLPNAAMAWTAPGKKPAVNVAAAVAPDGTWRIGMTNFTQDSGDNYYTPAVPYDITLVVDELAGTGDLYFAVTRTREDAGNALVKTLERGEVVTMTDGRLVMRVYPRELLSLRESPLLEHLNLNDVADLSASGATGTGISHVPGRIANAASFNGSAQIDLPTGIMNSRNGAVSLWLKTGQTFTEPAHLYYGATSTGGDGFGSDSEMHLNLNTAGRPQLYLYGSGDTSASQVVGPTALNDDQWHHVVASWQEGGNIRLWVDGELVGEAVHHARLYAFTGRHRLGRPGAITRRYTGLLDDIALFGGPLDQEQVRALREKFNFESYTDGGITSVSGEDVSQQAEVLGDGTTFMLTGNTWKKVPLNYTITADTILSFDFESTAQGEAHGMGFSTADAVATARFYRVYGTESFGLTAPQGNYPSASGRFHYAIRPGVNFTGFNDYLLFGNDHDVASPTAMSRFSNVRIYERPAIATFDLEAEAGVRQGAFVETADAGASAGTYVLTPDGAATVNGAVNYVEFTINIVHAGTYQFFGRVRTTNTSGSVYDDDSFNFQIDDLPLVYWAIPNSGAWTWSAVRFGGSLTGPVYMRHLDAGVHIVRVRERENGASLDRLVVTNDLGYVP